MYPETVKSFVVLFVVAGSALLACAARDDTTYQYVPPGAFTGPTRIVVDAGLVTLSEDAMGGVMVGGAAGQISPEAGVQPDLAAEITAPDAGGIGSPCDVFATATTTPPTACSTALQLQCSAKPDGTGICTKRGLVSAGGFCDSDLPCGALLFCATIDGVTSCTQLCRPSSLTPASYCSSSPGIRCAKLGQTDVGYCSTTPSH